MVPTGQQLIQGDVGRASLRVWIPHTGYVICNIDLAAAASSPHIISLTTISPDRSSDRRMGRPTIDGYWYSGKFCGSACLISRPLLLVVLRMGTTKLLLTCAAYPTLRKPVPPSRTACVVSQWTVCRVMIRPTYGGLCHVEYIVTLIASQYVPPHKCECVVHKLRTAGRLRLCGTYFGRFREMPRLCNCC